MLGNIARDVSTLITRAPELCMIDWQQVVTAHQRAVWRIVYRLVGDHDDAADCFQETFLAAYRFACRNEVSNWSALLTKIATAKAIDRLRARCRERMTQDSVEIADANRGPVAVAEGRELAERLREAVIKLPDSMAQVFCLRVMEEMSYEEIARQLDLTTNAVGVLLNKARKRLHKLLSHDE